MCEYALLTSYFIVEIYGYEGVMERRLTAIVAADIVDYSIFMGICDTATIEALKSINNEIVHPAIRKHNAKIIRLMGDGSLLAFNSAFSAMQFAFDLQNEMAKRVPPAPFDKQMRFRLGANLCDVIIEENDIHGDGINIAARLQELAPPGGICVSHGIYSQTKNMLDECLTPIGERQLKNISEPVFAWRWQPADKPSATVAPYEPCRRQRFYGRQVLDPQVTAVLFELYLRSARLALLEALDEILAEPDGGQSLSPDDIDQRLNRQLYLAAEPLFPVLVEHRPETGKPSSRFPQTAESMTEFVGKIFDRESISLRVQRLGRMQSILRSGRPPLEKRIKLQEIGQAFLCEDRVPQMKRSISLAFVEA